MTAPPGNQSVAKSGESGQEGTTTAKDGAKVKKADKEEAAIFFLVNAALCAGGRKQG